MTSPRVQELETLLGRMRMPRMIMVNYDGWDQRGREHSSPKEVAEMEWELANATRTYAEVQARLEALVATLRVEEPHALESWIAAHEAYLAWLIANDGPEKYQTVSAELDQAEWARVRAGSQAFVNERCWYDPNHNEHYRATFGIDMKTLAPVS